MKKISRRRFLLSSAAFFFSRPSFSLWNPLGNKTVIAADGLDDIRGRVFKNDGPDTLWKWSKEGFLYTKIMNRQVVCGICPNRCVLAPGDRSVCRSKVNVNGKLYSLAYGNPCSVHVDPVEKKPLYHFMPKSKVFSLAAAGCNFRCLNCQNWEISQQRPEDLRFYDLFPKDVIAATKKSKSRSIAYTYSEAITYFEYMLDTAGLARNQGIYNLLISNGFINKEPLLELSKVLDGANINLKAFSDRIYKKLNGGRLAPVLNTFKTLHQQGIHFEITNLVVPGHTDDESMVKEMCRWILDHLGPDYPLHFSRFFPKYKLNRLSPTPVSTLTRFRRLAMEEGIRYVYIGNVPGHQGTDTYCHHCRKVLIERKGYFISQYHLLKNRCRFCNTLIPGVWDTL